MSIIKYLLRCDQRQIFRDITDAKTRTTTTPRGTIRVRTSELIRSVAWHECRSRSLSDRIFCICCSSIVKYNLPTRSIHHV